MKKMWIKKENLYHKPFYKQKLKMTMLGVLFMGIVFLAYQLFYINQLQLNGPGRTTQQQHSTRHIIADDDDDSSSVHQPAADAGPFSDPDRDAITLVRGVRREDLARYVPNANHTFRCWRSGELLNEWKVNDDYCDCEDRSDEPSTNACVGGVFYCTQRTRYVTMIACHHHDRFLTLTRVNLYIRVSTCQEPAAEHSE